MSIVISFEGLPLTGKSSLATLVHDYYKIKGYEVVKIVNSHDTDIGIILQKRISLEKKFDLEAVFLASTEVVNIYQKVLQLVGSKDIIIIDSMFSYFLIVSVMSRIHIKCLEEFILKLSIPHLIFYVVSDFKNVINRKKDKHDLDVILASEKIFNNVNKEAKSLLLKRSNKKIIQIENNQTEIFETFKSIKPVLDDILKNL